MRLLLFLLNVVSVLFSDRIELSFRVLFARVLLVLVVEGRVVHVTFSNAVFVAFADQFDESIL